MKRILGLSAVILLVAVGVWGYFYVQSRGQGQGYRLARVERGPLTAAVSATGNLNAVITVQVGSQVSGQIKELFVDFNSPVKKGQLIARIDPETFEAKVNQAQADVETARAALAEGKAQTAKAQVAAVDTKRDLDRKSELFKRELIAKSDLDTSQAGYDSAVAALDATKAKEQSLAAGIGSAEAQLRVAHAQLTSSQAAVKQKQAAQRQAQV